MYSKEKHQELIKQSLSNTPIHFLGFTCLTRKLHEISISTVKTIYDCKEPIVEPFYFPVVATAYEE